jgi:hypothetical protein
MSFPGSLLYCHPDTTLYDKVCQRLAAGQRFSPGTPVSSTNKTDCHDITEILLVTLIFDLMTPKINRVLPFPQGNHVAKFIKDPIYRIKVIVRSGRPHRFPHNNFSSVYQIFTKLGHMIPLWLT